MALAKVILVASGKGGVGKSTVSALLGEALAQAGHATLLAELDSGLRSLDVALGVTESVLFDMGDVARGGEPADSVMPCPFCGGLDVICAAAAPAAVGKAEISYMIKELGGKYEFILLDCPAGLGETLSAAAKCADAALLVTTPDPAAVRAAASTGRFLEKEGVRARRLVIERCPKKPKKLEPFANLDEVINGAETRLIGVIWDDPATRAAVDSGKPLPSDSPNKKMFCDLAERLLGRRISIGFK